jgi:hypothetical protein
LMGVRERFASTSTWIIFQISFCFLSYCKYSYYKLKHFLFLVRPPNSQVFILLRCHLGRCFHGGRCVAGVGGNRYNGKVYELWAQMPKISNGSKAGLIKIHYYHIHLRTWCARGHFFRHYDL